ncbi:hypothetical protein D3C84_1164280 [compost metagenome]
MARVVATSSVGDTDDGSIQSVVTVAGPFDECLAQEKCEAGVTVVGQPFADTGWLDDWRFIRHGNHH